MADVLVVEAGRITKEVKLNDIHKCDRLDEKKQIASLEKDGDLWRIR